MVKSTPYNNGGYRQRLATAQRHGDQCRANRGLQANAQATFAPATARYTPRWNAAARPIEESFRETAALAQEARNDIRAMREGIDRCIAIVERLLEKSKRD